MEVKGAITSKNTIAFFKPKLPIMVRVEASYNEGLSAGLFQHSAKGGQPVHFISRSVTFAYLGIARRVTSDNGPPFNSEQFKDFAKEEGFVHH